MKQLYWIAGALLALLAWESGVSRLFAQQPTAAWPPPGAYPYGSAPRAFGHAPQGGYGTQPTFHTGQGGLPAYAPVYAPYPPSAYPANHASYPAPVQRPPYGVHPMHPPQPRQPSRRRIPDRRRREPREDEDRREEDRDRDRPRPDQEQVQPFQDQQLDVSATDAAEAADAAGLDSLSADTGAAAAPASAAPNMIGDNFGATFTTIQEVFPEVPLFVTYTGARANLDSGGMPQSFTFDSNNAFFLPDPGTLGAATSSGQFNARDANFDGVSGTFAPLQEPRDAVAAAVAASQPGQGIVMYQGGRAVFVVLEEDLPNPAFQSVSLGQDPNLLASEAAGSPSDDPNDRIYQLQFFYTFQPTGDMFRIPDPGRILLGQVKIAENGTPIPQDRVFVSYSVFDEARLVPGGMTVQRTVPGFEKTFGHGQWSIEMRFPYGSTLDSDVKTIANGNPANFTSIHSVEFGDISMVLKRLVYCGRALKVAAGLQWTVPTADDLSVELLDGTPLLDVRNESVHLMPYCGWLYQPNDRFFMEGFVQLDGDVNGNPVRLNPFDPNDPNRLENAGRLEALTFLYVDLALGYWMYRNNCAPPNGVKGFAPMLELHYNQALDDPEILRVGNVAATGGALFGDEESITETVNMVVGSVLQIGNFTTLSTAYTTPVGGSRQFDGEFRMIFNREFGR